MKPEPISKHVVCSCCGLNWEAHGPKPTMEKCVELLKAEVAKRPRLQAQITGTNGYGFQNVWYAA